MNEEFLINSYLKKLAKNNPSSLNLNDDVFFDKTKKLVISVDTYNEGVHFLNFNNPDLVVRKIIRSSISDIYAKGVKPNYFFLAGSGNKKYFTKKNMSLIKNSLTNEQNRFNIKLSGGDTTSSKNLSFTVISLGYSNKIVYRNKARIGDDIYLTGNVGDSHIGLKALKNKINLNSNQKKYFINKYYSPNLPIKFSLHLIKIANCAMDVSDGLVIDLNKLINKQNLGYLIDIDKIPISNHLKQLIKQKKLKTLDYLFNGDDYQILFTASKSKRKYIKTLCSKMNQKISIIGQINTKSKNYLLDNRKIPVKNLKYHGYSHIF
ncbi:thiamine-phosphate kinase [Candidatus Pelagibacter sp.]|nr:thiamine-phosphate kinase [Candidatus Pelagibacter sp.]